ncbi:hypothetical protein LshimejAT787_3200140 [Lyophyllum shimeji]|uniref:Uncharacterized protein n=1 Tax=Lyophyllum shimeji TaxID=47721 RepID=A0A9P3Q2D9_LYOSH|nr:hypothetical protein LshimejAT787_3200140 [Lyophyllum shimeji]
MRLPILAVPWRPYYRYSFEPLLLNYPSTTRKNHFPQVHLDFYSRTPHLHTATLGSTHPSHLAASAHVLIQLCLALSVVRRPRKSDTLARRDPDTRDTQTTAASAVTSGQQRRPCYLCHLRSPGTTPSPHVLYPGPAATAIAAGRGGREYRGNGRGLAPLTAQHPRVTCHGYDPPPNPPLPGRYPHPWPVAVVWVSAGMGPQPARSPGLSSSTKPDSPSFHQSTSRVGGT